MSYEESMHRSTNRPRKRPRHTFEQNEDAKDYLDEMLEMIVASALIGNHSQ